MISQTTWPMPPPVAAAVGVWSIPLPFPNPLTFAYAYAWEGPDGIVMIDAGWDSDACWQALCNGLERAGRGLADIIGVVATHVHPDHYGLATRMRREAGAWVAIHPAEQRFLVHTQQQRDAAIREMEGWLRRGGAPREEMRRLDADASDLRRQLPTAEPDHDLLDGQVVPGTSGQLVALHTPGHTPGHLCFHDPVRDLLFTGDHLLPRITPNVSLRPRSDENPLQDFLTSIDRLRDFDDVLVLPGHEWPFDQLSRRLDGVAAHHTERLDEMEQAVRAGASTAWQVMRRVMWSRPFDQLEGPAVRSAFGETQSHLRYLADIERLVFVAGSPDRWRAVG